MQSFNDLDLPEALRKALQVMNFSTPTEIQAKAIPIAFSGQDLIGCAQTGTGKTAAFSLPILSKILNEKKGVALILVPTRELAEQVFDVLRQLTRFTPTTQLALVMGGVEYYKQVKALQKSPSVIVATPGRMMDHLRRKSISLANLQFLVLDEADRMLDMGFAKQLNEIMMCLPKQRQTMLFSATLPGNIKELARKYLTNPAQVGVEQASQAAPKIAQKVLQIKNDRKNDTLLDELNARKGSVLVFVRTKSRANRLFAFLESYGVSAERIHGDRSQAQRSRALDAFRANEVRVLVATDVAARGIDVPHIETVINYDLPMDPEDYVHRIGRTGRAGRSGESVSFMAPEERGNWTSICRLLKIKDVSFGDRPPEGFARPFRGHISDRRETPARREFQGERSQARAEQKHRPNKPAKPGEQRRGAGKDGLKTEQKTGLKTAPAKRAFRQSYLAKKGQPSKGKSHGQASGFGR